MASDRGLDLVASPGLAQEETGAIYGKVADTSEDLLPGVNAGGNESGNQLIFVAPTALSSGNTYLVDGVEITEPGDRR